MFLPYATCVASDSSPPEKASVDKGLLYGVQVTQPQIASIFLTAYLGGTEPGLPPGLYVSVEPGVSGGKAALGVGYNIHDMGFYLRCTVLRTWWEPWGVEANDTYIGPEVVLYHGWLRLTFGLFWNLSDEYDYEDNLIFSWGVGMRL